LVFDDFQVQWYPGHMAKARRELVQRIKQADFVIEVADARAPATTRNPELEALIQGRPRLLLLAKADLAEPGTLSSWVKAFRGRGVETLAASLTSGREAAAIRNRLQAWVEREFSRRQGPADLARLAGVRLPKSAREKHVRGLVVGIPNTGKSTLIRVLGGKGVQVGAIAGVTRALLWVNVAGGVKLLDTPGILWPRLEKGMTALKLAWLGCVGDGAFDPEQAALKLIQWFAVRDPEAMARRYRLAPGMLEDPPAVLAHIARQRGHLESGGSPDLPQGAESLLWDFRRGRLGRLALDDPVEE